MSKFRSLQLHIVTLSSQLEYLLCCPCILDPPGQRADFSLFRILGELGADAAEVGVQGQGCPQLWRGPRPGLLPWPGRMASGGSL